MARGVLAEPRSFPPADWPSAWMRDGVRPGSFWGERVRQTIAAQVDRIRHWRVFNCSYEDLPFSGEATWFVDPPYQTKGSITTTDPRMLTSQSWEIGAGPGWGR